MVRTPPLGLIALPLKPVMVKLVPGEGLASPKLSVPLTLKAFPIKLPPINDQLPFATRVMIQPAGIVTIPVNTMSELIVIIVLTPGGALLMAACKAALPLPGGNIIVAISFFASYLKFSYIFNLIPFYPLTVTGWICLQVVL